ncbi:MAG TPA: hypothetical protein VM029_08505 [Opitutaceae bacterium]|nr:hypothetical protein [Opitutaceae bacterium]
MKNNSQAFVNQIVVCLLVTIFSSGAIGLGTVWMRQQISRTANTNRRLEASLKDLERRINETNAFIAVEQSQEALQRRNVEFALGLAPVSDAQVMHVSDDTVARMVSRANRALFRDTDQAAPATITFALSR